MYIFETGGVHTLPFGPSYGHNVPHTTGDVVEVGGEIG